MNMFNYTKILLITIASSILFSHDCNLIIGEKAPAFSLKDQSDSLHTLSFYHGKKLALYFYPKDNTPGCTKEACSIRDNYSVLTDNNITILGVSYDNSKNHNSFIEKYNLPFNLLCDVDKSVSKKYCADGWFMPKRKTILIDEEGKIVHIFDDVNVGRHGFEILDKFHPIINEEE